MRVVNYCNRLVASHVVGHFALLSLASARHS